MDIAISRLNRIAAVADTLALMLAEEAQQPPRSNERSAAVVAQVQNAIAVRTWAQEQS